MRILFLDDNNERRGVFRQRSIGCVVDFAVDADEAIAFLRGENKYDLIMLDHDLGGPETEGQLIEGAEDGRHVAKHLASLHPKHVETTIVIHSLNYDGAIEMLSTLHEAGYTAHRIPFGWRMFEKTERGARFNHNGTPPKPSEIDILPDDDEPE